MEKITEDLLRKWVENTIFIDSQTKKKLLGMEVWPEDVFSILEDMFNKYIKKESDILNYIQVASNQAYIETIQDIEKEQKEKEVDELVLLEQELEKVG